MTEGRNITRRKEHYRKEGTLQEVWKYGRKYGRTEGRKGERDQRNDGETVGEEEVVRPLHRRIVMHRQRCLVHVGGEVDVHVLIPLLKVVLHVRNERVPSCNVTIQNIQSVGIFGYKTFSQ
jgi:hypothetical protein